MHFLPFAFGTSANILWTHTDSVDCAFFAFIVLLCCVRCRGSPLLNHHKHFIGWNWIPFARLFFLMALYNISETLTSLIAGRELNKCIPLTLEILKTGLMIECLLLNRRYAPNQEHHVSF